MLVVLEAATATEAVLLLLLPAVLLLTPPAEMVYAVAVLSVLVKTGEKAE